MIFFQNSPPRPTQPEPRRILIIKMSSLGDIIHALPALAALKTLYPQAAIDWAVEEPLAPLLPGPPYLSEIVLFPKKELRTLAPLRLWRALKAFRRQLRRADYDLSIDLQALAKSSLVAFLSGARLRLAYWETREGSFLVSRGVKGPRAAAHVTERYLDVIRYLGPIPEKLTYPLPDFSLERAALSQRLLALGSPEPRALFFPGASWETKRWPPENYAALGRELVKRGLSLVLGGSGDERDLTQKIIELAPEVGWVDLAGQTDLRQLMALTSLARLVVGSDSGPAHVAAAVGAPTISLYGPNSPDRTGVYGPLAQSLASPAPCAPCFKKVCPRGEWLCLAQIPVSQVLAACRRALGGELAESLALGQG
ncbi:MAG: lipopolysaccharide heptosyltransferase II [Deltaproteobacteria bacterium]|jgi:heptosyltransferase-1/heptosyltransferase-2|nr:lipopolysaccharide heptosyltransferase II [Deltaproteobacteria bacterium]